MDISLEYYNKQDKFKVEKLIDEAPICSSD